VASKTEREPQGGEPLLKRRCGESNKRNLLLDTALVLAITNRASPLYSQNKTGKIQTAIPCECLLGEGVLRTQADKRSLIQGVLI